MIFSVVCWATHEWITSMWGESSYGRMRVKWSLGTPSFSEFPRNWRHRLLFHLLQVFSFNWADLQSLPGPSTALEVCKQSDWSCHIQNLIWSPSRVTSLSDYESHIEDLIWSPCYISPDSWNCMIWQLSFSPVAPCWLKVRKKSH